MENKDNLILGGMAVMFLWLSFLTYNVFSDTVSNNTLSQIESLNTANPGMAANPGMVAQNTNIPQDANNAQQPAIKPTNTNTQAQQAQEPEVDPATAAKIVFNESAFDFGTLEEGEKVEHVFEFTNPSSNPLTITNARGSCGCTVPEWPKEPIPPGGTGEIKVKYDSKGKKGNQNKTVTITANTLPQNTLLNISADVIKLEE